MMTLTEENKRYIDSLPYNFLLSSWRHVHAPVKIGWFDGETGEYWKKRLLELKAKALG